MYKKILVPTDGSALSQQAAREAVDFARVCGAQIVAFAVAEPYPLIPAAEGAMVIDPGIEADTLIKCTRDNVEQVAQLARAAGVPCQAATAYSALPWQEIVNAATSHGCDLIFMASHGRRGLSRLLAGSVTQDVLARSTLPVMVLRPGKTEQHEQQAQPPGTPGPGTG
jgi:nucleotide-binding universal stress UspA family protein